MFLKNIQLAFRNLWRDKFYTSINALGLTIGMAAALLLFMWVKNEYSFDNFHPNTDRLYRVNCSMSFGGERSVGSRTPLPLAEEAKEKVPEIQYISTDWGGWNIIFKVEDNLFEGNYTHFVSPDYLKMFDFTFLEGNAETALNNPNSIVLTESFAEKLFGTTAVMGKSLKINEKIEVFVTGLIKDFPKNSQLEIESLVPLKGNIEQLMNENSRHWNSNNYDTYTLLQPDVELSKVEDKLTALNSRNEKAEEKDRVLYQLQLVKDIYLGSNDLNVGGNLGDKKTIGLIAFIGLLILLIACINYVNLTTARAAHRAKSIGVQKIIGASKMQLFNQHFLEAICLVGISMILAIAIANLSLPTFENISGSDFPVDTLLSWQTLPILLFVTILTILLSGIQPALQLSNFKPIVALKGSQFNGVTGKISLRKILVISQFTCSAALVICTLIMMQQMDFIKKSKLGYEKEHVFTFFHDKTKSALIKNELTGKKGIEAVTLSDQNLVNINSQMGGFTYEGMPEGTEPSIYHLVAGEDYQDFFDLSLKEGKWFREGGNDKKSYILNEAAVAALQLENPIGKWMDFWGRKGTVVGVLKDFHFRSFHHTIEPLIFVQNKDWYYRTFVKTTASNATLAIATAEKVYKSHHPNKVFRYEFLDEAFDNLYKKETQMGQLFSFFALLTIFISCLGIFGLATYTAERRGKEIGIRKVLGASVLNIINLLSFDFLKLVIISLLISMPIAWYLMDGWLENFAFSTSINWSVFALTGAMTILIAYFTIGFQSVRAALVNPAETLKSE